MTTPVDFGGDVRPAYMLQLCDRLLQGPGLDDYLITKFFRVVECSDADAVVNALADWLRNERRFPFPVDIRELIAKQQKSSDL